MAVMRSPILKIGMVLVLIMKLDYTISTAFITKTTPRSVTTSTNAGKVHGYNETCIESGPDGQCSTINARCLIDGDDTGYRCRCTDEDYYHQDNESCLKRPGAPKNVTLRTIFVTTNILVVGWTAPDENQKGYRVVVGWTSPRDNTLPTYNTAWEPNHSENQFGDLESGTEYTFNLYLEKESIRTILLDTKSFYTKPEPIQTLRFEDVWEKNFTVVWNDDPSRPCKSYIISLDTGKRVTIPRTNDTSQRFTFTNLTGGTGYVVTITAEVPGQSSEPLSKTSYTIHGYNETCIESGQDEQCSTVNARCLSDGDDTGYRCRCMDEDYYHQNNDSCLKPPDKVQGMNVETGANNLTVTWNSPLAPNGIIRKYRVDVIDLKENCIISQTIYTCSDCRETSNSQCGQDASPQVSTSRLCNNANETNLDLEAKDGYELSVPYLHPYKNYTVEITPFTRCYGTTMSVSKLTKQAAPTGVPIDITQSMSGTTNNTLSLTWYPPLEDKQNGVITEYTVYIKYNNRTCYGEQEGNEVKKQIKVNSTFGETSNNVTITDLYPFWSYSIVVSASTVAGEGPNTTEVHMMTNQSPPDVIRSPPSKVNTSSSSIDLKWDHPCYVNGIITKYQIHVFSLDDNTTVKVYETQTNETRDIIGDLKPYHNYTVSVAAINTDNETGPALNTTGVLRTNTGVPFKPTNIRPSAVSATSLKIQWERPSLYTGVTMYNITAKDVNSLEEFHVSTGWDFNRTEIVVNGLDEYWYYNVTVTAITQAGSNTSVAPNQTRTRQAAPGSVVNLNLTTEMNVISPRIIYVVWEKPKIRDLNGILTSYFVKYTSDTQGTDVTRRINIDKYDLKIMDIKPGPYNVTVFAATSAGNGSIVEKHIDVPPGAPIRKPENASVPLMKESSAVDVDDDETQIAIDLPTDFLCDDSNGRPIQYGLIVAAADHATDKQFVGSKTDFNANIKSTYKNWFEIRDMDKPKPYITTPETWKPCQNRRKRDVTSTPKTFTIGEDGECSGIPTDQNCNGQLKPATSYRIKSYVCTEGGCSETLYSAPIKTISGVNTVIIVVALVSCVVISLAAIGVVIYLQRRRAACFAKREENDTHGVSETIPGTEMVTKTSANRVLRRTSEEDSNPYDVIGYHRDEERSAYYNIDRRPYDVLKRSNDRSHEYSTFGQDRVHAKPNGKMYENLRRSHMHR